MPNWVSTEIYITGSDESIKKLFKYVKGKRNGGDEDFDFNKIIPRPKSLGLPEGSLTRDFLRAYFTSLEESEMKEAISLYDKIVFSFFGNNVSELAAPLSEEERKRLQQSAEADRETYASACGSTDPVKIGETYFKNVVKYGATSWYGWSVKNWGTKWNACDVCVSDYNDGSATIFFNTAWGYAYPILQKLAKKFKELVFDVWYADEDYGYNCGHVLYKDGVEDVIDSDEDGEPRYDIAERVLGYSYEELVND